MKQINRVDYSQVQYNYLLAVLLPLCGLIFALKNWRQSWAKNVFWLACVYLGAIQIYHPAGTILGEGADGGRYVLKLINMYSSSITLENVLSMFMEDGSTLDLYQPLLTFLISRFTDNGHVLFLFFAIVFGFFYSRNIWYVLERLQGRLGNMAWVMVAFFFLVCPIWQINGVRMWTALHIFVYGAMPYLLEKDKSKLIWCFLSVFIHFSFLYPILLFVVYMYLPKRMVALYFVCYLVTLVVKEIDLLSVREILLNYSPGSFEDRIVGYTNEEYAIARQSAREELSWHVTLAQNISYWIVQIYIVLSYFAIKRYLNEDENLKRLYLFSLMIYAFANVFTLVPSGARFISVAQMFVVPVFLFVIEKVPQTTTIRQYQEVLMLIMFLSVIFTFRKGLDFYGFDLFIGNYLTIFILNSDVSIMDLIKQII